MKKTFTYITLLLLLIGYACNEDNLDKQNPNVIQPEAYYKNEKELLAAVNSIYAQVQSAALVAREYWFLHDLRADEMAPGGGQLEVKRAQLLAGTHVATNELVGDVWNGLYRTIHRANIVIEKGPDVADISEAMRKRLMGEAQFLRAWAYFELVSLWGGTPLYETYVTDLDGAHARSSETDMYTFIIANLQEAALALPLTYDESNLGRITQGAAYTLLSRVYMQHNDYPMALTTLQQVEASMTYSLADDYFENFTEEGEFNNESIWEIGYAAIGDMNWDYTGDNPVNEKNVHTQEYSAIGWRNLIPSDKLLDEFERPYKGDAIEDPRLHFNFYFTGDTYGSPDDLKVLSAADQNGNTSMFNGVAQKISWKKYSLMYKLDPGGFTTGTINQRMMRYAEVLLMMAECLNETDASEAAILSYLNATRARPSVAMPLYPTLRYPTATKQNRRDAIMHEKMVELAAEQVRNRDILRWRALGHLTAEPISYYTSSKFEKLPIPQTEIDNNAMISQSDQNEGY